MSKILLRSSINEDDIQTDKKKYSFLTSFYKIIMHVKFFNNHFLN